ncbi:MAG: ABC transporter substrate-binding protein [Kiritimatiellia bacterium]
MLIFCLALTASSAPAQSTFRRHLERVNSMDPANADAVPASRAVSLVYETLLEYDYAARPYRLIPGVAMALPEVSSNGQVYVFHLDPEARFAPDPCFGVDAMGKPRDRAVRARDFVYALQRLTDRKTASSGAWLVLDNVRGMRAFAARSAGRGPTDYDHAIEGLQAPDDQTLRIELTRPFPQFAWLLAMSYTVAVPREAVEKYGRSFGEHPVGSGPYTLASWRRNHEMVFTRNAAWRGWRRCPTAVTPDAGAPFDRIVYRILDDPATRWISFLSGELDFQGDIPRDNWDAVVDDQTNLRPELARKGLHLTGIPTMEIAYIGFNMEDPVLGKNKKLRQALNCAFDSPAWESFQNRRVVRADGAVPPGAAGYAKEPFAYAFDLTRAKQLLAEAGYPDGRDPKTGRRLTLALDIGQTSQDARESAELLAAFLARAGIELQPQYQLFPAFLRKIAAKETQLFRLGWVGDYPDAENFLQLFYGGNRSPGPNHCNYINPDYDRLYEKACATTDEVARLELYRQMQAIVREDCPWLFLHFPRAYSLHPDRLRNYLPHDFPYGMEKYLRTAVAPGRAAGG